MLTSLSVDEILLLRYMNCSTIFRGLPFNEEMVLSWSKHMSSVLSICVECFLQIHLLNPNLYCVARNKQHKVLVFTSTQIEYIVQYVQFLFTYTVLLQNKLIPTYFFLLIKGLFSFKPKIPAFYHFLVKHIIRYYSFLNIWNHMEIRPNR